MATQCNGRNIDVWWIILRHGQGKQRCFKEVKNVLSSLPTIASPNWEQIFFVIPSVGEDTLGVLLMQKDKKTSFMRPIYFANRMMTGAKKGYNISSDYMVLVIMFSMTKFTCYEKVYHFDFGRGISNHSKAHRFVPKDF